MKYLIFITIIAVIVPSVLVAQINWTEHTIADDFNGANNVFAIDLDDDNDVDVLATSGLDNDLTWWENDGNNPPNFTEYTIDDNYDGAISVYAIDLDNDNDVDVLGVAFSDSCVTWWENDGSSPPNFTQHTIADNFNGASCVFAIDINGDSAVDVLGTAWNAGEITWWENDGNENFTKYTIKDNFEGAAAVYATDINGDSAVDVLGAAYEADDITWWENDGNNPPNFTEYTIDDNYDGAISVYAIDLDNDNDVDVLGTAWEAGEIVWWENDGNENFTKYTIDLYFSGAAAVYAIDLDDDDDVDVLGAAYEADEITWWENDGNSPPDFTKHTIADFNGARDVFAIALDSKDGDVDVLGAGQVADEIVWWESDLLDIYDAGVASIDIPSTVPEDTTLNPQTTVANFGSETISSFPVTCEIEPGGYTSTRTVQNLAPGDSIQVEFFADFTFESGLYTVTAYSRLSDDANSANDTLEKVIETYVPGVDEWGSNTPTSFSFGLRSNPAKGNALFNLALPEAATITLCIYDVMGRLLDKVISGRKTAGYYEIPWTKDVSSGIFFYHLDSPWQQKIGKLVLLK